MAFGYIECAIGNSSAAEREMEKKSRKNRKRVENNIG
jgi:hypothetical protein